MISLFSKREKKSIEWHSLTEVSSLDEIDEISQERPVLIFKHSTRCAISSMVLNKLENSFEDETNFERYFLDLITYRTISDEVAARYGVIHESPQAILISKGKSVYEASHSGIVYGDITRKADEIQ